MPGQRDLEYDDYRYSSLQHLDQISSKQTLHIKYASLASGNERFDFCLGRSVEAKSHTEKNRPTRGWAHGILGAICNLRCAAACVRPWTFELRCSVLPVQAL